MDYSNHVKGKLSIIPPAAIMAKWEADDKTMQENMIIGESLKWAKQLDRIMEIEGRFNNE